MKSWVSKITTEDTDYDDVVFATAAGTENISCKSVTTPKFTY